MKKYKLYLFLFNENLNYYEKILKEIYVLNHKNLNYQ